MNKFHFTFLFLTSLIMLHSGCKKSTTETVQPKPATIGIVSTSAVTVFTQTTANCGGNVTDDGGATVTSRGICYSITTNPTITNSIKASGSGKGAFTVQLTGLALGQKYYIRAYATNSVGTSYGEEKSFTTDATLALGLPYAGGLIFYLDSTNKHGLVCSEEDQGTLIKWGCPSKKITGALGTGIGKGAINTTAILSACNDFGIAADVCSKLTLNGYSDWFLPSFDEVMLMYTNLAAKGIGNFKQNPYWTSTQTSFDDAYAQTVRFYDGGYQSQGKDSFAPTRAARAF